MLPGKDGFTVASELRAAGQFVPILMLTARGRPEDVLRGFESGADDYLPKPFELAILMARLNGLQRRRRWNEQDVEPPETPPRDLFVRRPHARFRRRWSCAHAGKSLSADADGVRPAAYLVRNAGQADLAPHDSRGGLGPAREHRHARDRQLHRSAAALPRRSARVPEVPADRARRRLSSSSRDNDASSPPSHLAQPGYRATAAPELPSKMAANVSHRHDRGRRPSDRLGPALGDLRQDHRGQRLRTRSSPSTSARPTTTPRAFRCGSPPPTRRRSTISSSSSPRSAAHAVRERNAVLKPAEKDRCVPDDFYSTTNHRTHVRLNGRWVEVDKQRMDAVIVVDGASSRVPEAARRARQASASSADT